MQHLYELTNTLILELERLKDIFSKQNESTENKQDYFQYVKEETTHIYDLLSDWEEEAMVFVKKRKGHVHYKQIVATKENMQLIILHRYYKDLRKRTYMQYPYSC